MAKQAQTLTRDAIQYETKRDFSKSQHSKQNKHFLATATALNTNETSKYTYELLLTSADRLLLSKIISLHYLLLALEHTFLFITTNGQASADTDKRRDTVWDQTRFAKYYIITILINSWNEIFLYLISEINLHQILFYLF